MELRVLGCSGGIGGWNQRTTSLLVDNDILIDCGTGAGVLYGQGHLAQRSEWRIAAEERRALA